MMRFALAMMPPPRSRFGPLATGRLGELHTIVLIGVDGDEFAYLDPYYPATGQPFRLSEEEDLMFPAPDTDLAGSLEGPEDLSSSPRHLAAYGR